MDDFVLFQECRAIYEMLMLLATLAASCPIHAESTK